mmetsp:Transcript_12297/g.34807  ORF Transcript_12297/g.34807 Transcript_12297/m.34807 type:complete len:313 (+) Transcript_12297:79-1017(+)
MVCFQKGVVLCESGARVPQRGHRGQHRRHHRRGPDDHGSADPARWRAAARLQDRAPGLEDHLVVQEAGLVLPARGQRLPPEAGRGRGDDNDPGGAPRLRGGLRALEGGVVGGEERLVLQAKEFGLRHDEARRPLRLRQRRLRRVAERKVVVVQRQEEGLVSNVINGRYHVDQALQLQGRAVNLAGVVLREEGLVLQQRGSRLPDAGDVGPQLRPEVRRDVAGLARREVRADAAGALDALHPVLRARLAGPRRGAHGDPGSHAEVVLEAAAAGPPVGGPDVFRVTAVLARWPQKSRTTRTSSEPSSTTLSAMA